MLYEWWQIYQLLLCYFLEMINLPATKPEVHEYLADENVSRQIGKNNPFGCIPIDQAI